MLEHLMKWVFEFLTLVGRANTFGQLWSRLPPCPGLARSSKAYWSVSQWQGKEMRNLLCVLLAIFTATLSWTSDQQLLTTRHKSLVPNVILCVRYMTDFMLLAQYKIHTPGSIQSMIVYVEDFHKNKTVFLRFRATKAIKSAVRVAMRDLQSQQRLNTLEAGTSGKRKKLTQEFLVEKEELEQDLLTEGTHYNFPKMNLISHFPDIISQFGSFGQYATEICEASHKAFKRAYDRSNHINILTEHIDTYTRTHSFVRRELNIAHCNLELQAKLKDVTKVLRPTPRCAHIPGGIHVSMKRQGRISPKKVYNLKTLAKYYSLPDLQVLTKIYRTGPNPDLAWCDDPCQNPGHPRYLQTFTSCSCTPWQHILAYSISRNILHLKLYIQ